MNPRRKPRRGVIRQRKTGILGAFAEWLADRTIYRRWRRLSCAELLILFVVAVVSTAFLILLGMQSPLLAIVVAIVILLFIYKELGA